MASVVRTHLLTHRRLLLGNALLVGILVGASLSPPPVFADPCQGTANDNLGCDLGGGGGTDSGGNGGGGNDGGGLGRAIPPVPGDNQALTPGGGRGNPPPPVPATSDLAEQARSQAPLPVPKVHTSPENKTYVQVRTGLWVENFSTVRTPPISIGNQTVQATAAPKSVTWSLGDTSLTCNGPGRPGTTECSHIYKRSSAQQPGGAYQITATIIWSVSWTCTGSECDAAGGTLADMEMTSVPRALIVGEIQTNTRP